MTSQCHRFTQHLVEACGQLAQHMCHCRWHKESAHQHHIHAQRHTSVTGLAAQVRSSTLLHPCCTLCSHTRQRTCYTAILWDERQCVGLKGNLHHKIFPPVVCSIVPLPAKTPPAVKRKQPAERLNSLSFTTLPSPCTSHNKPGPHTGLHAPFHDACSTSVVSFAVHSRLLSQPPPQTPTPHTPPAPYIHTQLNGAWSGQQAVHHPQGLSAPPAVPPPPPVPTAAALQQQAQHPHPHSPAQTQQQC